MSYTKRQRHTYFEMRQRASREANKHQQHYYKFLVNGQFEDGLSSLSLCSARHEIAQKYPNFVIEILSGDGVPMAGTRVFRLRQNKEGIEECASISGAYFEKKNYEKIERKRKEKEEMQSVVSKGLMSVYNYFGNYIKDKNYSLHEKIIVKEILSLMIDWIPFLPERGCMVEKSKFLSKFDDLSNRLHIGFGQINILSKLNCLK